MGNDCAVYLEKVSKRLRVGVGRHGLTSHLISLFSGVGAKREIWPTKDVSIEIKKGERLGIIGRNGSGKSTLLKIISGVYKPDSGKVVTMGDIVLLCNLTNGIKPRLSIRDNIFLVGAIFGLKKSAIDSVFDEVIDFSELGEFVYSKFYQLSNGMKQRLAFSTTMHFVKYLSPDILLLDEVISGGGDEKFNEKSSEKISEVLQGDKSLVMVTHKFDLLKKFSEKVLWMENGKIIDAGKPEYVIRKYLESVKTG